MILSQARLDCFYLLDNEGRGWNILEINGIFSLMIRAQYPNKS